MKAQSQGSMNSIVDSAVNRFSKNFKVKPEEAYEALTGSAFAERRTPGAPAGGPRAQSGTAYAAPTDKPAGPSLDAIDAELKRRGVKTTGASGGF